MGEVSYMVCGYCGNKYQHFKKIKPLPAESSLKFKGIYGGTVAVPRKHFDFVVAYVSARV